ncbi:MULTISPECIES: helix-turn-helix domain-containing protein [Megasphaera]|uniref:PF05899 family protein n=1 Tax=Megasphaera vaginalis (ex Srinivasan et al. 2021) TaxID=1111454 RepID=U7UB26_9FIRM|nr:MULTISPECIES: cupin domain-containing protein [Megasphaera]ERT56526.1 PF05899 family protein [Megasphaera vaginalis (ex Srinivasan et al. 2021)]
MNNYCLGKNISQLRLLEGYSLKELASKVEISLSMLSQIEHGNANPSLKTLEAISCALKVPIVRLFSETQTVNDLIVRSNKRTSIIFPESPGLEYEVLTPNRSSSLAMLILTLKAHGSSGIQKTKHTGEEIAYILEGNVHLVLDNEEVNLNTHDSVRIPPGITHQWVNVGDDVVRILFAASPPRI